ncbi:MAG: ribosome silencing factor [Campylobacterales bacterium]
MELKRVHKIKELIEEKKGLDLHLYDLRGSSYYVDFVVVATIMADRHGYAILDYLKEKLKPAGEEFFGIDQSDDWIVIDLGDILIHLMSQEYRARYQLDQFLEEIGKGRGGE